LIHDALIATILNFVSKTLSNLIHNILQNKNSIPELPGTKLVLMPDAPCITLGSDGNDGF